MEEKGKVLEDCFLTWVKILEMKEKEGKADRRELNFILTWSTKGPSSV